MLVGAAKPGRCPPKYFEVSLTALVFTWDERMGMSLARGRLTEAGDTNPESEWWRLALVGTCSV